MALLEQIQEGDGKEVVPPMTQEHIAWHRAAVLRGEEDFAAGRYYTHAEVKAWIREA